MKKRVIKFSMLMSLCAMAYFSLPMFQAEAFVPYKFIQTTECVNQVTGEVQGSANDCIKGSGACRDRGCLSGEAEQWPIE